MSGTRDLEQDYGGATLRHVLAFDGGEARPAVILFPTVLGVTDLELGFARRLVGNGYQAMVADLYGRRFGLSQRPEAKAAMDGLRADRAALRDRLLAVLETARAQPEIDARRVAAIGFCFGGLCALDLARGGADVAGVASFHGLFDPPGLDPRPIRAKIIAFHGWDDPLAPPEAAVALARELTEAGADWQIHAYGHTRHGFTNPGADAVGMDALGYSERATKRSWAALENFLGELFE